MPDFSPLIAQKVVIAVALSVINTTHCLLVPFKWVDILVNLLAD